MSLPVNPYFCKDLHQTTFRWSDTGNRLLVVSLTNLADLQAGKRGEGDRIWLEVKQKGN